MSLAPIPASPYDIHVWQGSSEGLPLVIQARDDRDPARLCRFLAEHHDYEEPEIIAVPVTGGSAGYLNWVSNETQ